MIVSYYAVVFAVRQGPLGKGAEKALCRETVVQKGVFGESVSSLPPFQASGVLRANLKGAEKRRTLQKHPLDNRFSARRLLHSFGTL